MRCRLCDSIRLISVLDLGATPPCESFLSADDLDAPETTYPLDMFYVENWSMLSDLVIAVKTPGQFSVGRAHIDRAIRTIRNRGPEQTRRSDHVGPNQLRTGAY